jgi:hypothetical protein
MGSRMSKPPVSLPKAATPKPATKRIKGKTDPDAPRENRSRAVAELLPAIGGAAFRRFGFVQSSIVSRWPEIVGAKLAGASIPESIRFPLGKKQDGVLTLTVRGAHAPMMQHIAAPVPRKAPPSIRPVPVDLGASLKGIADPELRAVLESLAAGVASTHGLPRIT